MCKKKECKWREQINIKVWKCECEFMMNIELFQKANGANPFIFCPGCAQQIKLVYAK